MLHLNTQDVVLSIENTTVQKEYNHIYQHYHNFFGNTNTFDLNFEKKLFDQVENQEQYNRKKLSYTEIFSKKLHIFFMNINITKALQDQFSTKLKFLSVDYWIDNKEYFLPSHVDNDSIKLSLQIYLGKNQPGTVLFNNDKAFKTFDFKNDSGYAMLLNDKTFHGLEYPVKQDGRRSIYVRYQ